MYKREGEKGKILFLGLDNLIYIAGVADNSPPDAKKLL